MKVKVEWNEKRNWKITKEYKDNRLSSIRFLNKRYFPVQDFSGRDYIDGNAYIACDVCNHCELQKHCKTNNPIQSACEEYNELETKWITL